jgi:hypothetical protein
MFVYAVSSPLFDRADPYWVCRLSALKVAYVGVILFIVNAFFKSPTFPVLEMLVTTAAVAVTELPSINSHKKKILAFIGVVVLCITTNSIFGLVSFFKWGLLIGVGLWTFILYHFIAKDRATANLVGVLILIGIVTLEGDVATDLNGVINHALFYFEYAAVGLVSLLLFPNLHDRVIKSAVLRLLEIDRNWIKGQSNLNEFDAQTLKSLLVIENQANQVQPSFYALMPILKALQLEIRGNSALKQSQAKALLDSIGVIYSAVRSSQPIHISSCILNSESLQGSKLLAVLNDLSELWNSQCQA